MDPARRLSPSESRAADRALMPFMATFSCLWCGRAWQTRGPDDLEGWSQLCADCIGAAGDDGFRRMRLRAGLAERAAAGRTLTATTPAVPATGVAAARRPIGIRPAHGARVGHRR